MAKDIGIDLGTSTTTVYVKGKGIVLSEPSVVAVSTNTGKPIAVGTSAERMIGRTPGTVKVVRPVRGGAIADFETAEFMLKYFLQKACGLGINFGSVRMILSVPTRISEVEQLAVLEAAKSACGRSARVRPRLIEEPLAAAIGANLPLRGDTAEGSMIIDVGGGTAEVAVISLGSIIAGDSVKVGGENFDTQVVNYMRTEHNLVIGEKTAETVKMRVGCVFPQAQEKTTDVCGRDMMTGLPGNVRISSQELIEPFKETVIQIVDCAKRVLDGLPPEISADIIRNGITMSGGGSLLTGLCEFLRTETNVPVRVAEGAQYCVAQGIGRCLTDSSLRALINSNRA
ncbi:MAG: rod shape-determining protein [Clostridia bacterium]|jgi:rod shape-determining protein MreB|nr:rod shape-determining protein [Clostridia bacterium]MBO7399295.1 rod shape-determining protein [Clostridia bacterium]MBP5666464.1 rod shape-determining protein [Clostridia bacterium]MBP5765742.1 rod shape-determining protein [Clostridia bacterium]MBR5005512.1 rod shape-determining protein [Clostridia bacterium]